MRRPGYTRKRKQAGAFLCRCLSDRCGASLVVCLRRLPLLLPALLSAAATKLFFLLADGERGLLLLLPAESRSRPISAPGGATASGVGGRCCCCSLIIEGLTSIGVPPTVAVAEDFFFFFLGFLPATLSEILSKAPKKAFLTLAGSLNALCGVLLFCF